MSSKAWARTLMIVLGASAAAPAQNDPAGAGRKTPLTQDAAASSTILAASPAELGKIVLGLRLGYGLPMGSVAAGGDAKLSDLVASQIPIQLDVGYLVTPNVMLGVYGQYAFGVLASNISKGCDALGTDCRAFGVRLGLQGHYYFLRREAFHPWVGLGIGYEWNQFNETAAGVDVGYRGFEFATLQGGVDLRVRHGLGMGPFIGFSMGQYSSASSGDNALNIREKAMHEWLTLGVRGTVTL